MATNATSNEQACAEFLKNPSINPYTGKSIKLGGPTWKQLQKECSNNIQATTAALIPLHEALHKQRKKDKEVIASAKRLAEMTVNAAIAKAKASKASVQVLTTQQVLRKIKPEFKDKIPFSDLHKHGWSMEASLTEVFGEAIAVPLTLALARKLIGKMVCVLDGKWSYHIDKYIGNSMHSLLDVVQFKEIKKNTAGKLELYVKGHAACRNDEPCYVYDSRWDTFESGDADSVLVFVRLQ